jgi:hypothetical protein
MNRRTLLAGTAGAVALGIQGARPASASASAACAAGPLQVVSATPDTALTGQFNAYSNSGVGWTGADSTYSTPLPDGRQLFIFSDTFLGPVNPDGSRPRTTPFINNSFIIRSSTGLRTVHGGTDSNPTALVTPADPSRWAWLGAGLARDGVHQQIAVEFGRTGTGPWDFAWMGTSLARFSIAGLDLPDVRPIDLHPLPAGAGVTWASWLQQIGAYLYVYGVEDNGASKYLHMARVSGTSLLGAWSYWTGSGWSANEADSVRVLEGVSNEYSVTPWCGRYLLVTQDTTELFSAKIVAYVADAPTGPFTGKTLLYSTPETGALGSYGNPNIYTYNPHVHPELSSGNSLVVSYNVNDFVGDELYGDVSIYRPRFIDVVLA